jgi:hypothetical protein
MPAKPRWLLRIPEIVDSLKALATPVVDRCIIEQLFGLRERRARELMQRFAGYQCGNAVVLNRVALIDALQQMCETPDAVVERARRERLSAELERTKRYRSALSVRIPERTLADLPAGVRLEIGRLTIEFDGAVELLSSLFELSKAAANDFDRFRRAVEANPAP